MRKGKLPKFTLEPSKQRAQDMITFTHSLKKYESNVGVFVAGGGRGSRGMRGNTRGRGGGGGRGGRGFGRGARAKVPTAEELDAELDAYVNQVNK